MLHKTNGIPGRSLKTAMLWGALAVAWLWGGTMNGEGLVVAGQTGVMAGVWRFSSGSEFPGATGTLTLDEKGVLHLAYDFTEGGAYVAAYCDLDKPQPLKSVAFRARKPDEAQLTVRVTNANGQTFQKSVLYGHAEWQHLSFDMRNWAGHWGGPEDGVFRPPISTVGILVESSGLASPTGEVLIAEVNAEGGRLIDWANEAQASHQGEYVVTDFGADAGFSCGSYSALHDGVLTVDFAKTATGALHHSLSLLGRPSALTLTVHGGAEGNVIKMTFGSHFQTFERTVGTLDGGEKTFTFPVPPEGWSYRGGENDGKVRYPLRLTGLVLERGDGPAVATEVELAELRCATEVALREAITLLSRVTELECSPDTRTLAATCTAWNLLDQEVAGTLTMTVRDWENNLLDEQTTEWSLPAKGARKELTWNVAVPAALNFADAEFRFDAGKRANGSSRSTAATRAGFVRPIDDAGDATLRPESPWGMGVYLYRYPHNPEGHARMDQAAAMAQAAGVKWSREEFSWGRMETKPGEYAFDFYDVVVDTALRHGISVYGLLAYWSQWTQPYTEEGIDDFCQWARATVRHFKDRVKHWEIYNEPNIFFWSGPRELYPMLVKKCYAAIKEEDPEAQVLAISTAGIDRAFINQCLEADAPFDILTIHPYRGRLADRGFRNELESVAELVGGRPVWITEMGWSSQIGGVDERTQAQLLARCYLGAVASGACQNVSWYDFRNDGNDPFYNEANFGVIRNDMTPKPAYRALATVCRTLASGEPRVPKGFGDAVFALEMGDALALWSPARNTRVVCRVGKGDLDVFNLMGDPLIPERDGNRLTIELRPDCRVFLTGAKIKPLRHAHTSAEEDLIQF